MFEVYVGMTLLAVCLWCLCGRVTQPAVRGSQARPNVRVSREPHGQ